MKIRYYKKIDGWRWIGFVLAMVGAWVLSNANPDTQWLGWSIAISSCSIWIYMGWKDKDIPRALMEFMYLIIAVRAIWNWLMQFVYIGETSIVPTMLVNYTTW